MKKILLSSLLLLTFISIANASANKLNSLKMSLTDITNKIYKVQATHQGLTIQGLKGKVIFLEFFGHQCPPCLRSIPHLAKLQKKYKNKLAIIGIEVQGYNQSQLRTFAKQKGINYIVATEANAAKLVDYISQRAQWSGSIPFLVALDTKGDVQFVQAGALPESSLEELIKELSD